MKYGQQDVDFDEGILFFMAPMQVLSIEGPQEPAASHTGWLLLVHPDLLWNTHLAKKIRQYEYFDYKANETLHLSESEEQMIVGIMQSIAQEYRTRIDNYSQDVLNSPTSASLQNITAIYECPAKLKLQQINERIKDNNIGVFLTVKSISDYIFIWLF